MPVTNMKGNLLVGLYLLIGTAVVASIHEPIRSIAFGPQPDQLLWSESKAYIFIGSSRLGWRRSIPRFAWDELWGRFGLGFGIPERSDTQKIQTVVTIADGRIDVRTLPVEIVGGTGVMDGRVYALEKGRGLVRWNGSQFELATAPEQHRYRNAPGARMIFTNEDGWSGRFSILSQSHGVSEYPIRVGGIDWKIIARNQWWPDRWIALDVQRGDELPQRVWTLELAYKSFVSKEEYDRFLLR